MKDKIRKVRKSETPNRVHPELGWNYSQLRNRRVYDEKAPCSMSKFYEKYSDRRHCGRHSEIDKDLVAFMEDYARAAAGAKLVHKDYGRYNNAE